MERQEAQEERARAEHALALGTCRIVYERDGVRVERGAFGLTRGGGWTSPANVQENDGIFGRERVLFRDSDEATEQLGKTLTQEQEREKRAHPFANGSQSAEWDARNCNRCAKVNVESNGEEWSVCPIWNALTKACVDDGSVSWEIAGRMGFDREANRYTWPCPEFEAKE